MELDSLYWMANWEPRPWPEFIDMVEAAISDSNGWIIDGNYSSVRTRLIEQATAVIWLDPPLIVAMWRLSRRTFGNIVGRKERWNGNRESFRLLLKERFSLFSYAIRVHRRLRHDLATQCVTLDTPLVRVSRPHDIQNLRDWVGIQEFNF